MNLESPSIAAKESRVYGIAEHDEDAGIQEANAGLGMDMGTHIYKDYLKKALETGTVSMDVVDEVVRRILSVKMWLGLFEDPYVSEEAMQFRQDCPNCIFLSIRMQKSCRIDFP